jgi:phosphoserine phosphatase
MARTGKVVAAIIALALTAGCSGEPAEPGALPKGRRLDPTLEWYGDNRAKIDALLDAHGKDAPGYDASRRPVAVLDWDDTVVRNDIGEAVFNWMMRNDKILQPPGGDFRKVTPWLTEKAAATLTEVCGSLAAPGEPLPTAMNEPCMTELQTIYQYENTMKDWYDDAFAGYDHGWMSPPRAWAAGMLAGYTAEEAEAIGKTVIDEALAAEVGAYASVGYRSRPTWMRIHPHMQDLIGALQDNGFDVWIVSDSLELFVKPFAARVGIAPDHVLGLRLLPGADGKLTARIAPCGGAPEDAMASYRLGKRCLVNREIFGIDGPAALERPQDEAKRPTFVAGDDDGNVELTLDATALRLVLNSNAQEMMCRAYHAVHDKNYGLGKTWAVNPLFVDPLPQTGGFGCSCEDRQGNTAQCTDDVLGYPLYPEEDTVFCKDGIYCKQ